MWPFNTKTSYIDSGVLRGATDWHCHLLPGVDDGVHTMKQCLSTLRLFADCGFRDVWFTPHIMEDIPNTTAALRERFAEVQEEWNDSRITLHLAAENMLDYLFLERLEANDFLPIGKDGEALLVETSYYNPPYNFWHTLEQIHAHGYHIILAHPERYQYMEKDDYTRLHDMGVQFQLNLSSLVGAYGPEPKARAQQLLALDYYSFKGTDTHRESHINKVLHDRNVAKSCLKRIATLQ